MSRNGSPVRRGRIRFQLAGVAACLGLLTLSSSGCGTAGRPNPASSPPAGIESPVFVGYVTIPPDEDPRMPLGGLSGLAWDDVGGTLYAISDDKGDFGTPRIYRLAISFPPTGASPLEVAVEGWIALTGWERPGVSFDPEAVALAPGGGGFFVTSEGWIARGLAPFVARFDDRGRYLADLALPERFRIGADHGPRQNKVFESLAVTPSGRYLFTATESSLVQDGPDATVGHGSVVRILRWDLEEGRWAGEVAYATDPIHAPALQPGGLATTGVTELLALDDDTLLALERSFAMGSGFAIRLYRVELAGARDVSAVTTRLSGLPARERARKTLLVDFSTAGIPLDNYEGLALGPRLPDGRRSLLVVSDDNFSPALQSTYLLLFALSAAE